MMEGEEIAFNGLEVCSYRHLQSVAKQMGLPSNVKKVYLIQMIRAKKYCSEKDLQVIVDRVKSERKANAQAKKKQKKKTFRVQGAEISSTSNSRSPPISQTPKRQNDFIIQYSPNIGQTMIKYQPHTNIVHAGTNILQRSNESDRVLRSFHSLKRPNYRILDQSDCVIGLVKSHTNTVKEIRQERLQEIRQERIEERAFKSVNVTLHKQRPMMNTLLLNRERQLVPVISRAVNTSPKPAKRQRKVSGIYPIHPQEKYIKYLPTVGLRQTDGRVTKINAVIQKPLASTLLPKNHFTQKKSLIRRNAIDRPIVVTVQDVINYKVDHPSIDLTSGRPMESRVIEIDQNENNVDLTQDTLKPDDYDCDTRSADENDINAVRLSYQGKTLVNIVPEQVPQRDQSIVRKVYKNRHLSTDENTWNQKSNEPNEWNFYTNQKPLNDAPNNTQFNQSTRETEPVSTNYKVKQGRISAPIGREQRFDYQMMERNIEHARNMDYARNGDGYMDYPKDQARNIAEYRKANEIARNLVSYAKQGCSRNIDNYSKNADPRNVHDFANMDLTKNTNDFRNDGDDYMRNMQYARNTESALNNRYVDARPTSIAYDNNQMEQKRTELQQQINLENYRNQEYSRNLRPMETELDPRTQYPNMSSLTDVIPNDYYSQEVNLQNNCSVYYHKKIRADQVRKTERLPRINDVFSQFKDAMYKKLCQPLYVKVSEESERVPIIMNNVNSTCMLESFYNFKSQFLTNQPLLKIATTMTECTFSTRTMPTAVALPASTDLCNNSNPYGRPSLFQPCGEPYPSRFHDYQRPERHPDITCDEVLSSSTATLDTPQPSFGQEPDPGANVAVPSPEMVEDALELISQDGDYMERIGMDVRVQCLICDWAGPKFILEYHIKKEHPSHIRFSATDAFCVTRTLGSLTQTWSSQLLQTQLTLYIFSAKCVNDTVSLALSAIPNELEIPRRGRITVFNKRTGKPFSYEGEIKALADSMPYEYGLDCLNVDLASLDIPNSANLRLATKEFNDIEIVAYVKLLD